MCNVNVRSDEYLMWKKGEKPAEEREVSILYIKIEHGGTVHVDTPSEIYLLFYVIMRIKQKLKGFIACQYR